MNTPCKIEENRIKHIFFQKTLFSERKYIFQSDVLQLRPTLTMFVCKIRKVKKRKRTNVTNVFDVYQKRSKLSLKNQLSFLSITLY